MFAEKLKDVMNELNITQKQLVYMTDIPKSSISQYLSGRIVPAPERQMHIAESLGLERYYFAEQEEKERKSEDALPIIPRLTPDEVAAMMGQHTETIREGLIQGRYPWGYAVQTTAPTEGKPGRWTYWINARKFSEEERVALPKRFTDRAAV